MDITKWGQIADLVGSPIGTLVLAFFVWKMAGEMKEMRKVVFDNGFLKKEDMEEAWKRANEVHLRQDEHLERLDHDVVRLETNDRDLYGQVNRLRERA